MRAAENMLRGETSPIRAGSTINLKCGSICASTPAATSASAPKTCTGVWDFIETDCQLTWYGITLYGVIDAGFTYQTHGAPLDPRSPPGSAYIVQRYSRSARWDLAPNGLQNSFIGIKGTEPIAGDTSVVFALDAGFDPYSLKLSNGPGSAAHNAGVPQDQQTSWADSSRAGQWYNGNGYVGVSSKSYGTLTVFRQNALTYDGVLEYDPMGASYAFSPIGWQGRRQHRKLQTYDIIEIPPHPRTIPGGGAVAVRRLRAEQRLEWRVPGRGGRRYPEPRQRRALV